MASDSKRLITTSRKLAGIWKLRYGFLKRSDPVIVKPMSRMRKN
jgi:hypothetical protein